MFQRNYIAGWNVNYRFEILLTRLILVFTAIAAIMLLRQQLMEIGWKVAMVGDWSGVGSQCIYVIVIILLIYGNFVYKLTRLGYLQRRRDHEPASRNALELVYSGAAAPLAVLVPSYHEEIAVVRRTLLSAALQEYPERHIILLIDDAYNPQTLADTANLEAMRELPRALQQLFDAPARHFEQAYRGYLNRRACSSANEQSEAALLAQLYSEAADWLEKQIAMYFVQDHGDALLINELMEPCKNAHRARAEWLASLADIDGLKSAIVLHEYRRLATLFRVEFASFERKRYENLSHQPNKAMNLNSYIEIMGKSFREVPTADGKGLILAQVPPAQGALHIPDAVFVLTLDADSLLAPDYALRMVHIMNQSGNERIAIAQTPYSTIPGAPGILERIAGATTDIQYLIHQGFTKHNATFWVGANALLRKAALEDIHTEAIERGYRVTKYIQDRTVIEDTESTMDLVRRGWTLYNYPERLAYSATPADFGSLLIQRRRWANGGLIILPKALRYLFRGPITWWKIAEGFFRVHYLSSIAAVNIGLLVIPFCSSERNIKCIWLPLSVTPYFYLFARDLVSCGYRWADLLQVYALNLILIPVNLGGVFKSVHQSFTGKQIPFRRTPKVTGRTAVPGGYVLGEYALFATLAILAANQFVQQHWLNASFAITNAALMMYSIYRFIGLRDSAKDLRLWLRRPWGSAYTQPISRGRRRAR